mmetsp:Transcript_7027/g.14093  ORF Transcript_7027/g.14093 Transcript_7027/m.14093 type:complete len:222 (-) Transcript_7027:1045-1710(-)
MLRNTRTRSLYTEKHIEVTTMWQEMKRNLHGLEDFQHRDLHLHEFQRQLLQVLLLLRVLHHVSLSSVGTENLPSILVFRQPQVWQNQGVLNPLDLAFHGFGYLQLWSWQRLPCLHCLDHSASRQDSSSLTHVGQHCCQLVCCCLVLHCWFSCALHSQRRHHNNTTIFIQMRSLKKFLPVKIFLMCTPSQQEGPRPVRETLWFSLAVLVGFQKPGACRLRPS